MSIDPGLWGRWSLGIVAVAALYLAGQWEPVRVANNLAGFFFNVRVRLLLAGAILGYLWPPDTSGAFETGLLWGVVFFYGWFGLVAGLALEGRSIQRQAGTSVLLEGGIMCLTVAIVLLVAYAATRLPETARLNLNSRAVLIVCGLCVVAGSLNREIFQTGRGIERRMWKPTLPTLFGIVLALAGVVQEYGDGFEIRLPLVAMTGDLVISGLGPQLLCACILGVMVGILGDLLTRDERPVGILFFLLLAVLLTGGGVAMALGLEPLWMGLVAGMWIINATLYRLSLIRMVERSHGYVQLGLLFVCGCLIGYQTAQYDIDWKLGVWIAALLVTVRSAARLAEVQLGGHFLDRRTLRLTRRRMPQQVRLDDIGLVLALHLWYALDPEQGVAVLIAAVLSQAVLHIFGLWLKGREGRAS